MVNRRKGERQTGNSVNGRLVKRLKWAVSEVRRVSCVRERVARYVRKKVVWEKGLHT